MKRWHKPWALILTLLLATTLLVTVVQHHQPNPRSTDLKSSTNSSLLVLESPDRVGFQTKLTQTSIPKLCLQSIQLVVSTDIARQQAEHFIDQFAKDQRLASVDICINSLLHMESASVRCDANWQQSGRLACDLKPIAQALQSLSFTHVVIFTEQGKANVHNGIMYLDQNDTYDVFVHELAHFAGFIDEYPLSKQLAARVCIMNTAPNMLFRLPQNGQPEPSKWHKLGYPKYTHSTPIGTCDNHQAQAYKPVDELTFMQFFDYANIPLAYRQAWQVALGNPGKLTSAHLNFAQYYEDQKMPVQAKLWRQRYKNYQNQHLTSTSVTAVGF